MCIVAEENLLTGSRPIHLRPGYRPITRCNCSNRAHKICTEQSRQSDTVIKQFVQAKMTNIYFLGPIVRPKSITLSRTQCRGCSQDVRYKYHCPCVKGILIRSNHLMARRKDGGRNAELKMYKQDINVLCRQINKELQTRQISLVP